MATKIIHKKSSVASKVPLAADLEVGEIALNLEDQKIYSKQSDGTVVVMSSGNAVAYEDTVFTTTSGQTSFTIGYTAGKIDVFLNGIKLDTGDYTATNGTTIVLNTAAEVDSTLSVRVWDVNVTLKGETGDTGPQGPTGHRPTRCHRPSWNNCLL